jgi:hypothetical protein
MAYDGMTGIWPEGLGNLADPVASALRVIAQPTNGIQYTGGWTLSAASAPCTGLVMDSRAWGRGVALLRISGREASATIDASPDGTTWVVVSAYYTGAVSAVCDNLIALEQCYPYIRGRVDFASAVAGGISAGVWMYLHRTN